MMDKRILDKIKKLMALANRTSNPHEAASALAKAQKLMAAHQLSLDDVDLLQVGESAVGMANASKKQPLWAHYLLSMVRDAFGVQVIIKQSPFHAPRCVFIGLAERAEVAAYCYTVLARQLIRARRDYLATLNKRMKTRTKTARADLYCQGWVNGVDQQVEAMAPTEREAALVERYFAQRYPSTENAEARAAKSTRRDHNAAFEGYQAGKKVTLNAGVKGEKSHRARLERRA